MMELRHFSSLRPIANNRKRLMPNTVENSSAVPAHENLPMPIQARHLLQVRVPVSVTLAAKKQPVKQILELAPGSLIHFNKTCDQLVDVWVGEQRIAQGIAVKVGERFGLCVDHLVPPAQRLQALKSPQ